jgi:chromosome segregation ATPase
MSEDRPAADRMTALKRQLEEARERVTELEDELDGLVGIDSDLETRVIELKSANDLLMRDNEALLKSVEQLEAQVFDPTELQDAANGLLEVLERALGPEQFDEPIATHAVYRAMDDLRDALREPRALGDDIRLLNLWTEECRQTAQRSA